MEELVVQLQSAHRLEAEFPLPKGPQSLLLLLSADWMRPTHIVEGNLFNSKSADLNVNFI